jgi:hypothetical protein
MSAKYLAGKYINFTGPLFERLASRRVCGLRAPFNISALATVRGNRTPYIPF